MIEIPVTDGHINYWVKATVGKRESIEIQGKMHPCLRGNTRYGQVGKHSGKNENPQLKIWYTADERKIPLRIRSKLGIVSFVFDLVSIAP